MALAPDEQALVTGGGDAVVQFWRDTTAEDAAARLQEAEVQLERYLVLFFLLLLLIYQCAHRRPSAPFCCCPADASLCVCMRLCGSRRCMLTYRRRALGSKTWPTFCRPRTTTALLCCASP
jgi:hypothetical protein